MRAQNLQNAHEVYDLYALEINDPEIAATQTRVLPEEDQERNIVRETQMMAPRELEDLLKPFSSNNSELPSSMAAVKTVRECNTRWTLDITWASTAATAEEEQVKE
jgi:hypothetical protein